MEKYSFEKLAVWQDSRVMIKKLYLLTSSFPENEKFGLVNQMRRAAISIASNLAEGSSRTSTKDQAHFYQIVYSSAMELLNQLIISYDLQIIKESQYTDIRTDIESITYKINALRKAILNKVEKS
ncbi:MAG: four helix bundle protein [Bacteroidota bacterium]